MVLPAEILFAKCNAIFSRDLESHLRSSLQGQSPHPFPVRGMARDVLQQARSERNRGPQPIERSNAQTHFLH